MPMERARAAVCVLTVERQPHGVLIAITVNPDVSSSRQTKTVVTDPRECVAAVATFLQSFIST